MDLEELNKQMALVQNDYKTNQINQNYFDLDKKANDHINNVII